MSEQYHRRPSEILGLESKLEAYFFDRAVFYFGVAIDADVESSTRDAKTDKQRKVKQNMVMNRWGVAEGIRNRFKDPAAGRG